MKTYRRPGWQNESHRHSLAAKGVKTSYLSRKYRADGLASIYVKARKDVYGRKPEVSGEERLKQRIELAERPILRGRLSEEEKERARLIAAETLEKPSTRVLKEKIEAEMLRESRLGLPTGAFREATLHGGNGPMLDFNKLGVEPGVITPVIAKSELRNLQLVTLADLQRLEIQARRSRGDFEKEVLAASAETGEFLSEGDVVKKANEERAKVTVGMQEDRAKLKYIEHLLTQIKAGELAKGSSATGPFRDERAQRLAQLQGRDFGLERQKNIQRKLQSANSERPITIRQREPEDINTMLESDIARRRSTGSSERGPQIVPSYEESIKMVSQRRLRDLVRTMTPEQRAKALQGIRQGKMQ